MKRFLLVGASLLAASQLSYAADNIDIAGLIGQTNAQEQFKSLSKDLGAALSYKAVAPAEPLGMIGFDIGIEVTATKLENAKKWSDAVSSGDALDYLYVPKLHAHKGLPFGIDVGLVYSSVPTTNIKLIGGELRYAIISGNIAVPAVAVRGTYTKLSGVDNLSFNTKGLELSVSKGLTLLTPYAGVGYIWTDSDPSISGLKKETIRQGKFYIGANLNLALINLAVEGDQTGSDKSISAKLGLRF